MGITRVKICGITNLDDALQAIDAGADALGFVFFERSPRNVSAEQVRRISEQLPPFVSRVGLFVNEAPRQICQTMERAGLDTIQLHGDETPDQCNYTGYTVIKALRVKSADSLKGSDQYSVAALLLDAWSDEAYGGTGHSFDWQLARNRSGDLPLILAGGLTPENVATAIQAVRPYAVDVSSGVEREPRHKDHEKVRQFIKQVRNA